MAIDASIDYHAHILPECDHGCDCVETSLKQLEMASSVGIHTVYATPHFYPHKETVEAFLTKRNAAAKKLKPHLTEYTPKVKLGAEVLICDGMEKMGDLKSLCQEGTDELLLEMPFYQWPHSTWETLYLLCERSDIQIIIAHADRYRPKDIEKLINGGISLQLNVSGLANPLRRMRCVSWAKSGNVKYIGSDIHMLEHAYRQWKRCGRLLKGI